MNKINPRAVLATFDETWVPKILAELNGQYVKVAHLDGGFVWHSHAGEDELFLVLEGRLDIELRDQTIELAPGDLFVVPRGVEHRPVTHGPVQVLLFEPKATRNTGQIDDARTIEPDDLQHL